MSKRLKQKPDLLLEEKPDRCILCGSPFKVINGKYNCTNPNCPIVYVDFTYQKGKIGVVLHADSRFHLEEILPSLEYRQKRGDVRNEEFQSACF